MDDGSGASGKDHPAPGPMPFADDLLSARSRAWLEGQLAGRPDDHHAPGSDPELRPRIAGYTILQRVGRGGMGTVYECRRDGSQARLAIKIISSGKYASDDERRRFMAEIAALLRLRHPHLCRLRDFGQDGSVSWFVMDFIDGRPFHVWMAEEKPPWIRIADLLAQASRAVAHAHRQGIIHRDLNPANIMVLKDGSPVIMDFGLARDLSSDEVLTMSGSTVGTPPYMSPEQTLGTKGVVTPCSDVWGMGGVLYHALTGRPPFEGASTHEIFTAINETEVVRPSHHAKDLPRDLERIALRCLQRDPADRYQDLDALASDLERVAAGRTVRVRLPGVIGRIHRRARRHPLPWTLGAALILVGLGFLGYAAAEEIRRWATWTVVVDSDLGSAATPAALRAVDGRLRPVHEPPAAGPSGMPPVLEQVDGKLSAGWWWIDMPGLRGGSRLELDIEMPEKDAVELVLDASPAPPAEWWHHPAGWAVKVSSADQLTLSAAYLERPGPLPSNPGYLLDRPAGSGFSLSLAVEIVDTRMTVHIAGCPPVVLDEPLALGGREHRNIGLRSFSPQTRFTRLRIERLAKAELVSPLVAPDALLRHGHREAALSEYRLLATDHQGSQLGATALLRAYAVSSLRGSDGPVQEAIYREIASHERPEVIDQADRIRAKALWSHGETSRALGVARDLVARRPDLNPILSFLADRTWQVDRPSGPAVLGLLALAPDTGSLALAELGIEDLSPIAGRRAWSVQLNGNRIADLAPLIGSGCTYLSAAGNRIAELAPLARMRGLVNLNLGDNQVVDLSSLAGLDQLRMVNLMRNRIESLRGLPPGIHEAILGTLDDPGETMRMQNPFEPRQGGNPFATLDGLQVAELRSLWLASTRVADITALAAARNLVKLDLSDTPVRDLSPLAGLPITDLNLSRAVEADLTTLRLPRLQRFVVRMRPLSTQDLAPLLPGLSSLIALQSGLSSWPDVDSPALVEAQLSGSPLVDLSGLRRASSLRTLLLRGCGLSAVDPALASLPLERLDLRDNAITDLAPILARPPPVLMVTGNPLDDQACEALIAVGRALGRPDLVWQGASVQAHRRQDLVALKRVALPVGRRLVAPFLAPEPITADEAAELARRSGGRLAVIEDESASRRIADALVVDRPLWLGVSLVGGQVVDDAGQTPAFIARIPPARYRGYSGLPRDGGRLALAQEGNWALCIDGKAGGMVVEWEPEW